MNPAVKSILLAAFISLACGCSSSHTIRQNAIRASLGCSLQTTLAWEDLVPCKCDSIVVYCDRYIEDHPEGMPIYGLGPNTKEAIVCFKNGQVVYSEDFPYYVEDDAGSQIGLWDVYLDDTDGHMARSFAPSGEVMLRQKPGKKIIWIIPEGN